MTTYRDYQDARDAAWRALLLLPDKALPVDVDALAARMGAEIHPFPGRDQPRLYALAEKAAEGPCVSLRIQRRWHIFLREDRLDDAQRRFAVAHELGHLFLFHPTARLSPGVRCFSGRESAGDVLEDPQDLADYMADLFASRLLAPACVLHETGVCGPAGIMGLCGLPPRAAAVRAERMELLNERDAYYTHSLERQVRDAFLPWIARHKTAEPAPKVRLKYASEAAAPLPEIHGLPREIPPAPVRVAVPPPVADRREAFQFFLRRHRRLIVYLPLLLLGAGLLYWLGK